jgi:glyoxylase I family protein
MVIEPTSMVPLLQVFDMPEALAFYCRRLGFEVIDRAPEVETAEGRFSHWVWLGLGESELMLNTAYDSGERPARRDGARQMSHGDTGLFFWVGDVDAVHAALAKTIPDLAAPTDSPHGMRQLNLKDPDGYGLCFQSPVKS